MATPLSKKLGLKPEMDVWTIHAPVYFEGLLFPLPAGSFVTVVDPDALPLVEFNLAVLFATSEVEFRHLFQLAFERLGAESILWLAWPKKASKVESDLSFQIVQHHGLSHGLVDNKVCSIDETWTALRMVVRLTNRPSWTTGIGTP